MNIRKNIDYTDMYEALDSAMVKNSSQVEMYYEIGKAVCQRSEKGAAVAAAAYLSKQYPDAQGFSPRNLRRMRDFYRTYEGYPTMLAEALQIGWTQNVVIMEADLTMEVRKWYLKAARRFTWSKAELIRKIAENAHEEAESSIIPKENCDVIHNGKSHYKNKKYFHTICRILRISHSNVRLSVCQNHVKRRYFIICNIS